MASTKVWYVEATGHTNEVIARELPAENAHKDVLCQDGKKRNLWECSYSFISQLLKNALHAKLTFTVYYRESRHGPVKLWPFIRRRKVAGAINRKAQKGAPAPF